MKIGSPHFVDFGRNLEHSPDGKAYLVGHGASNGTDRRFAYDSWITGDEVYLLRVKPRISTHQRCVQVKVLHRSRPKGRGSVGREFSRIKPVTSWRDKLACVTMTYNAPLKKYLMCATDGGNTAFYFNTCILESSHITGPSLLGNSCNVRLEDKLLQLKTAPGKSNRLNPQLQAQ
jgi:hypothetical protein